LKLNEEDKQVAVVIPVYNCGEAILVLCERLDKILQQQLDGEFKMVLINDGSNATTLAYLEQVQTSVGSRLVLIHNQSNIGQTKATLQGLQQIDARYYITMDDDLKHLPEDIPRLIRNAAELDIDLLYAVAKDSDSGLRKSGSKVFNRFLEAKLGRPLSEFHGGSSFRLLSFELRNRVLENENPSSMLDYDLLRLASNPQTLFVNFGNGQSRLNYLQLLLQVVKFLLECNSAPKDHE